MELIITAKPFQLQFRHPFGIAHGTRNFTDTLYVSAKFNGKTGYGEAALPPYLGYHVNELVEKFAIWFSSPLVGLDAITKTLALLNKNDNRMPPPARAALDIALLDLWGKLTGKPVRELIGIPPGNKTLCSYTLGISSPEVLIDKLKEANEFRFFKIKLGSENDRERIETYIANSKFPFCVDANQSWKSVEQAKKEIAWLKDKGCIFIEQPFQVSMINEQKEIFVQSVLPIILDESIQHINDLDQLQNYCHGINIKLAKCGGITPAIDLIRKARKLNKKVLIGCMSESSCGAAAAAQLSGWADWVDLDGPVLISNDPFFGINYREGVLQPNASAGTGVSLINEAIF